MKRKKHESLEKIVRINISLFSTIITFKLLYIIYTSFFLFTQTEIDAKVILSKTLGIDIVIVIVLSIQLYKSRKCIAASDSDKEEH